ADATTDGVVVNREDPLLERVGKRVDEQTQRAGAGPRVIRFGLSDKLRSLFPNDDDFHFGDAIDTRTGDVEPEPADVARVDVRDTHATLDIPGIAHVTDLKREGLYNSFNAAAALATVRMMLADGRIGGAAQRPASTEALLRALAEVRPAFGRGEQLELDGV